MRVCLSEGRQGGVVGFTGVIVFLMDVMMEAELQEQEK